MANYYLRSTDGNDSDDGSTKALAKATLAGALAAASAGDRILAASDHSESIAASTIFTSPGTPASPVELLSINWATDALEAGASLVTTGSSNLELRGTLIVYGWTFLAGTTSARRLWLGGSITAGIEGYQVFVNCTLGGYDGVVCSHPDCGRPFWVRWIDCTLSASTAGTGIYLTQRFEWFGGSVSGAQSLLFDPYPHDANALVKIVGVDLSPVSTYLLEDSTRQCDVTLHRCRLKSGVSLINGTPSQGLVLRLIECDHGTNFIRQAKQDYNGLITEDTIRVRDDSNSTYSHKLVSSAYTQFYSPLRSFPAARLNVTEGSAITVRVDVLTDNVALTDGEFWIEVNYLGSASYPLGSLASSAKADILAGASNLATSTEGWTTTDLATPVKQYATVTFTPQKSGYVVVEACLAKASTTIYVDPYPTVS